MSSEALLTWRWDKLSRAQKKGTRSLESPSSHPHVECAATSGQSGYDHDHTSTSEDDLLKLKNFLGDTQIWTRFDKRAKTYRTTSSSGPLWENAIARITIDNNTGHNMSLLNIQNT